MAQQRLEQGVLLRREMHRGPADHGDTRIGVERQLTVPQHSAGLSVTAPYQREDARLELGEVEGFHQIVVRSQVEGSDPVVDLVAGGQHQHTRRCAGGTQRLQHLQAADLRQHKIEDHRIVFVRRELMQRDAPVVGMVDGKALVAEAGGESR